MQEKWMIVYQFQVNFMYHSYWEFMKKFDKRNGIEVIFTMNFQEKIVQSDLQVHSSDLRKNLLKDLELSQTL